MFIYMMIKFNTHNVTNGTDKARVHYNCDNRVDGAKCVTIYAKDYSDNLAKVFGNLYENDTDTQTDYFDKGRVTLYESHPLYRAARVRAEANKQAQISKTILAYVNSGTPIEVAFDRVLGMGSYVSMAGDVYDALRSR